MLDEGNDQRIVAEAVHGLRLVRIFFQQVQNVVVAAGRFDDERVLEQLLRGDAAALRERMFPGQHGAERILMQRIKGQILRQNGREKAAVHLSADNPVMDLVIVAVEDLHLDLRIVLLEKMHDVRQPHRRHARKAADAQSALDLVVDVEGRLAQLFLLIYHFADVGDEPLSVVGQDDTLLRPREQLHAELLLEPRHHLADAGLRVVQRLSGLCEVAGLADLEKDFVAIAYLAHRYSSFSIFGTV